MATMKLHVRNRTWKKKQQQTTTLLRRRWWQRQATTKREKKNENRMKKTNRKEETTAMFHLHLKLDFLTFVDVHIISVLIVTWKPAMRIEIVFAAFAHVNNVTMCSSCAFSFTQAHTLIIIAGQLSSSSFICGIADVVDALHWHQNRLRLYWCVLFCSFVLLRFDTWRQWQC